MLTIGKDGAVVARTNEEDVMAVYKPEQSNCVQNEG